MRCVYCSNSDLFRESYEDFTEEEALNMLRKLPIDHLVLCGGEPTIQTNLVNFCRNLKEIGWHIKLDTNGKLPDVIEECLPYLDYIAVDIKTDIDHYESLTGQQLPWKRLKRVLDCFHGKVEYRTTLVHLPEITPEIVGNIRAMLPPEAIHTLHKQIIKKGYLGNFFPWTPEELAFL